MSSDATSTSTHEHWPSLAELERGLAEIAQLRVAVVGETIIDEYAYCDAIGKSGKEPMLVTRFTGCEVQAGGVLAIANHLADFCRSVDIVSALGDYDDRETFVRSAIKPGIHGEFVIKPNSPTIVKRRYVDAYSHAKMLGVYNMNPAELPNTEDFCQRIRDACARNDVVIVADYGHGLLTESSISLLGQHAPFLAINTQLNAANHGYNVVSKYPRADYACVHEGELRLDARQPHADLDPLAWATCRRLNARSLMVTMGRQGTALYDAGGSVFRCPARATKVVERVGAGDAVLALTSMASAAGLSAPVINTLGNLAAAQVVAVMGNRAAIEKQGLLAQAANFLPSQTCSPLVLECAQ